MTKTTNVGSRSHRMIQTFEPADIDPAPAQDARSIDARLAGGLAGIGFTMSLFIAGQAFPLDADFSAAKIAVYAASVLSAVIGTALLWNATARAA